MQNGAESFAHLTIGSSRSQKIFLRILEKTQRLRFTAEGGGLHGAVEKNAHAGQTPFEIRVMGRDKMMIRTQQNPATVGQLQGHILHVSEDSARLGAGLIGRERKRLRLGQHSLRRRRIIRSLIKTPPNVIQLKTLLLRSGVLQRLEAVLGGRHVEVIVHQNLAPRVPIQDTRLSGSGTWKMIFKHILPNIMGPILVTSMLDIGTMMMELAGLSFLRLGAKPPTAEWGSMMSDTRSLITTVPWVTFAPGLAIFVSVMIFNLLGDTIRDYADPRARTSS